MDESTFDKLGRDELEYIEEKFFEDIDPDDVEVTSSDGVLKLELRDRTVVVINTHRAARQIWMAAVADAWHFDYDPGDGRWRTSANDELRQTVNELIADRLGISVGL